MKHTEDTNTCIKGNRNYWKGFLLLIIFYSSSYHVQKKSQNPVRKIKLKLDSQDMKSLFAEVGQKGKQEYDEMNLSFFNWSYE